MDHDNYIKVPKELGRVLDRMGLPEYRNIQTDRDGIITTAPIEVCRLLVRMGEEYKDATDVAFLFMKAVQCADDSIREAFLNNQSYITQVSQTGNDCSIDLEVGRLQEITSTVTHLTKKYICMLIKTNFDTIVGATWGDRILTASDAQDSIDMGGTVQDICWWIDADEINGKKVTRTVGKPNYTTETVSIVGTDVTKYDLSYTNVGGHISATFTGTDSRIIVPGTDVINTNEPVTAEFTATDGMFINTVSVNSEVVSVLNPTFVAQITEHADEDLAVVATETTGVSVIYDANDPNAMGSTPTQTVPQGTTVQVSGCTYILGGKEFVRWNTASDGTGTDYYPGAELTVNITTTLYAIWIDAEPSEGITVIFTATKQGGGTVTEQDQFSLELLPEDGILGGLGGDNYAQFDVMPGTYTYTGTMTGYATLTGSITVQEGDPQQNITLVFESVL